MRRIWAPEHPDIKESVPARRFVTSPRWTSGPGLMELHAAGPRSAWGPVPVRQLSQLTPGFGATSTKWLWDHGAVGVAADTFGPGATMDRRFGPATKITALGGA
jgi:hypothetical protein